MKQHVNATIFVLVLAAGAVLLPTSSANAQMQQPRAMRQCKPLHAIAPCQLPTPASFKDTDTWGGPVYGMLDTEFLQGGWSGNDGTQYGDDKVSIFKGGVYTLCFTSGSSWGGPGDCANSFTYEVQAVVVWPGANTLGSYKGIGKIVKGTGRFANASGHLEIAGPFIVWPDASSPLGVYGRGNLEFNGEICGAQ
jgi:hypothetical protein